MVSAVSSFAFEVGDYAYTATQRLKIAGENIVQNGNFAEGLTSGGWCGLTLAEPVSSTTWKVVDGEGPNGESVLQSQGATADEPLCNVWSGLYEGQTYLVSFMIKGEGAGVTTVGTTVGNNYCDFFLNSDGSLTHATSTDEAPVVNVATAANFTNEWQTVSFVFTPNQGQQLVMHFEKLATNTMITNFSIHQVTVTYDDRIVLRKMAFAQRIMADPNFKNSQTEDAYDNFYYGVYSYVKDQLETPGGFDDPDGSASLMEQFDAELAAFMEAAAPDMATEANFKYITDLTAFPKYNRGNITEGQVIGGFKFRGENWQHPSGGEALVKQIQGGGSYNVGPGSVALYNQNFIPGKYYIAAEVRNAYCDSKYNLTWNMERDVKLFIGTDTLDCGIISGQDFQKFYMVGELKEGETFESGLYWDGPQGGGRLEVKSFEVRAFGDLKDDIERAGIWNAFIAQYNAVVSARNALIEMQADANYPWAKDSLQRALNTWDIYYNALIAKGWVSEDGKDTRVATNEELIDWTTYHGVEMYDADGNLLKYQLVRGYQNATNYVKAENQAITNLRDEIAKAELIRDDDMNQGGDKTTFQAAIDAAKNTLSTILTSTTDATREADEATVNTAIETLQAAEETFKNSVPTLVPIVDIDFSNNFEPVYTVTPGAEGEEDVTTLTGYTIKGAVGQMDFTTSSVTDNGDGTFANDQTTFALGCGGAEATNTDVLRVGKGTATVNLAEADIPTDNDVLRASFDAWFGGLINRSVDVELQNAAGERVAGFSYCLYGGTCAYNDFLNAEGKGLNIAGCGKSTGKDADASLLADKYKWQFDIIIDYKANTAQANLLTSPNKGAVTGDLVALNTTLSDNKIAKFVLRSNYDNTGRRSWFDNLVIYKYASQAEGINQSVGIANVNANVKSTGVIYTLSGMQVKGAPAKGIYIKDGKKFIVK
jgi:hypothetical protein